MAYYRLSKVVKMRRLALGVKREEFDADGPTGMTVYRMEEGKHKTSERTYRSLTRSMGIEESTYQGILKTKKLDELQMTYEIVCALLNKNHEEAEQIIERLEDGLDTKDMRNQQYLRHMKEMIRYEKAEIAPEEYEQVLHELLQYRVPKGYKVDMTQWPLHVREFQIMHALNNVLKVRRHYACGLYCFIPFSNKHTYFCFFTKSQFHPFHRSAKHSPAWSEFHCNNKIYPQTQMTQRHTLHDLQGCRDNIPR